MRGARGIFTKLDVSVYDQYAVRELFCAREAALGD